MIHVNRGATALGIFSEEDVREGLRTGRFALPISGGAKERRTGSRSRSFQSLHRSTARLRTLVHHQQPFLLQ